MSRYKMEVVDRYLLPRLVEDTDRYLLVVKLPQFDVIVAATHTQGVSFFFLSFFFNAVF